MWAQSVTPWRVRRIVRALCFAALRIPVRGSLRHLPKPASCACEFPLPTNRRWPKMCACQCMHIRVATHCYASLCQSLGKTIGKSKYLRVQRSLSVKKGAQNLRNYRCRRLIARAEIAPPPLVPFTEPRRSQTSV